MANRARPRSVDTVDLIARRELWPVNEAAYRLGMSRATLYRRVAAGELRATRVGSRTYITEAEVRRFVANAEAAAS